MRCSFMNIHLARQAMRINQKGDPQDRLSFTNYSIENFRIYLQTVFGIS